MSITAAQPCQKASTALFEDTWQRLAGLLEDPGAFAIQFVFSGDYALHSALLQRLQQTAHSLAVDCLELPKTSAAELADAHNPAPPTTSHQLAEAITRHCLARIFPPTPPHPRLLLLDLHQALPAAIAALLAEPSAADSDRQAIVQQALADSRALLLSRLNERRAQLAEFGPLLILLPEDWTKPAAQYAPDLWTQRLSSLYLAPPAISADEEVFTPERAASPAETTASPRAAERKILERWQEALRTGKTQRLPISDGWIAAQTSALLGHGQEAEKIAETCLQLAYMRGGLDQQMVFQSLLGDMRLRLGKIEQAREAYAVALTLAQKLARIGPDNPQWRHDLSVSYEKVADIQRRSDPAAALANYQASLAIRQDLARREPDNTEWQRNLSVGYIKVADIQQRNDPAAALGNYEASLKISQDLARREPDNLQWQRDLSVGYNKVANILQRSDPAAALGNYQVSLQIRQNLARHEPDNTEWQRDLSVSYEKVADIQQRNDPAAALANYQAGLAISQVLARREPNNTEWQRYLSVSYEKVADIQQRNDPAAALANYQAGLKIAQNLAQREPDNTEWQRDLSVSYDRVADIQRRSDPAAALANYQAGLKIAQNLAQREPDNTQWQRDLSVSYNRVADIQQSSDPVAALANYQASLTIRQHLARREPESIQSQTDLIISYVKLAGLYPTVCLADARAYLQAALDTALSLQQRGLLDLDQVGWPADIQRRLEALPPA